MEQPRLFLELARDGQGEFVPRIVDQTGRITATTKSVDRISLSIERIEFTDGTAWPKVSDPEEEEPGFGF